MLITFSRKLTWNSLFGARNGKKRPLVLFVQTERIKVYTVQTWGWYSIFMHPVYACWSGFDIALNYCCRTLARQHTILFSRAKSSKIFSDVRLEACAVEYNPGKLKRQSCAHHIISSGIHVWGHFPREKSKHGVRRFRLFEVQLTLLYKTSRQILILITTDLLSTFAKSFLPRIHCSKWSYFYSYSYSSH